jgi:hypothetical protein
VFFCVPLCFKFVFVSVAAAGIHSGLVVLSSSLCLLPCGSNVDGSSPQPQPKSHLQPQIVPQYHPDIA